MQPIVSLKFPSLSRGRSAGWLLAAVLCLAAGGRGAAADNAFAGRWALTLPGGGAGWLGIEEKDGALQGSILWGGGSVVPVNEAKIEDGKLVLTRLYDVELTAPDGKKTKAKEKEFIRATADGDKLSLTTERERPDGSKSAPAAFSGVRIPPVPPAPDLAKVKFGEPVVLFNGKDLTGWKLTSPGQVCGWSVKDGVLINRPVQEEGKPHKSYGNLRTEAEFGDFKLSLETRVPEKGNSGIYLRGIYEIQVADSFGKPVDSHNMGGVYSRITPTENASRPAGEWQTYEITLVDRHATVVLNGKKIIDNQPLLGCTGGALTSDEFKPGPIYLQGDHTGVDYRNIVVRPVAK